MRTPRARLRLLLGSSPFVALVALVALVAACGADATDDDTAAPNGTPPGTADDGGIEAAVGAEAGGLTVCSDGESTCTAFDRRRVCKSDGSGTRWVDETCPAGSGCIRGACAVARCSDECTLGTTNTGRACASWDIKNAAWATGDPATSLHDRAREYTRWLQRDHLPFGGLADTQFSDPSFATPVRHDTGDSALWTGTYLATESGDFSRRARSMHVSTFARSCERSTSG